MTQKISNIIKNIIWQRFLFFSLILSVVFFLSLFYFLNQYYEFDKYREQNIFFEQSLSILSGWNMTWIVDFLWDIKKFEQKNIETKSKNKLETASYNFLLWYLYSMYPYISGAKIWYYRLQNSLDMFEDEILLSKDKIILEKISQNIKTNKELLVAVTLRLCFEWIYEMIKTLQNSQEDLKNIIKILNSQIREINKLKKKYKDYENLISCLNTIYEKQNNSKKRFTSYIKVFDNRIMDLNDNLKLKYNNMSLCLDSKALFLEDNDDMIWKTIKENIENESIILFALKNVQTSWDLQQICDTKNQTQISMDADQNNQKSQSDDNIDDQKKSEQSNPNQKLEQILNDLNKISNNMQKQNNDDILKEKQNNNENGDPKSWWQKWWKDEFKSNFDIDQIEKWWKDRYKNTQNNKKYDKRSIDYLNDIFEEFWWYKKDFESE